jgi:class 3 adenylate cyclase
VVLPWPREQFSRTHVQGTGESWQHGFDLLLGAGPQPPLVRHQVYATLGVGIDTALYERFARQLMFGLARLHAQMLSTDVVGLVVWDGPQDEVLNGLLAHWASQGVEVAPQNLIDVAPLRARPTQAPSSAPAAATSSVEPPAVAFRVMAILFADVAGYSKIPEDRLPAFIEQFIGGIAARLGEHGHAPENVRRVGDGLLMVFATVGEAAECALDLVDWLAERAQEGADGETHWSRAGLPREMRMRIALHAGPLFECVDPLTHGVSFEGAHLSYAARIEPITPANQVYASEAFAALAASWPHPSDEFVCEYVGRTSFAKNFGDYPLYHVRRKR